MTTTYPLAANSSGFQRYDHMSPSGTCGPPCTMNFSGYFLLASKFGGLTRKPCTLSPFAPGNQKDSSGGIWICESTGSLTFVTASAALVRKLYISGAFVPKLYISFGCEIDMRVNSRI